MRTFHKTNNGMRAIPKEAFAVIKLRYEVENTFKRILGKKGFGICNSSDESHNKIEFDQRNHYYDIRFKGTKLCDLLIRENLRSVSVVVLLTGRACKRTRNATLVPSFKSNFNLYKTQGIRKQALLACKFLENAVIRDIMMI
jgi:hypothetical protein